MLSGTVQLPGFEDVSTAKRFSEKGPAVSLSVTGENPEVSSLESCGSSWIPDALQAARAGIRPWAKAACFKSRNCAVGRCSSIRPWAREARSKVKGQRAEQSRYNAFIRCFSF